MSGDVLVVAGEASGDHIAGGVASALSAMGVRCWGMGGEASARAGVRIVADLRASTAMGLIEVARELPRIITSYARLARLARTRRPRAALLVDYAEFNHRLGVHLRELGIFVLRCVAPQVWAWRPARLQTARCAFDRLAVTLPFEEGLWRAAGVEARYVGHPALDARPRARLEARAALGIAPDRVAVALLPGSRRHEVRSLAPRMLASLRELDHAGRVEARLAVAPSLDQSTRHWLYGLAARAGVPVFTVTRDTGAGQWLSAFDATLAASGTVTLESALAGAPPVIVYRVSPLTAAIARRLVRVPSIGLPNVLLDRRAYPELLQEDAEPRRMARALGEVLERRAAFDPLARELRDKLELRAPERTAHERIAAWMSEWVVPRSRERKERSFAAPAARA